MTEDTSHWSCYTTTPARSLEIFEDARPRCPLVHSSEHDGFFMLLKYADVKNAMADNQTFSSEPQVLRPMLPRQPIPALEMDPPRHGTWRALFSAAITAKTPREMESVVRADVNAHIDAFIEKGACDIVAELAEPVPAETICRLVGIDNALVPAVRRAAIEMFAAQGDPEEFGRKQARFAAVTVTEVHDRRARPREDYLTRLVNTEVEGHRLNDNDFVVLLAAFLGAGHHSTTSAMASLINEVFSRPAVRDLLRNEPGKIPLAVEETLRLRPPFFGFFRRATKPVSISGTEISQGCDVYMGWAAANRDPTAFAAPADFEIQRPQNRHLAFGYGIHSCPGSALARMELRVLLEELLRRTPDLQVQTDPPEYQFGGGDYSYLPTLEVTFTPRIREGSVNGAAPTPGIEGKH